MSKIVSLFKTEYDLANALVKKDARAYHWFYDKYSGKFLAIAYRYLGNKTVAEDLMVDSMMKIFDKIGQFNFEGSFEGWCKKIVVNDALSYLRKHKAIEINIEDNEMLIHHSQQKDDLELADLMKIINTLPIGYKTVFNLFAIEGYSHNEIAEKLGISEGTSKSQLSRARMILQDKLKTNQISQQNGNR